MASDRFNPTGLEPTIYRTQDENAYQYATDAAHNI